MTQPIPPEEIRRSNANPVSMAISAFILISLVWAGIVIGQPVLDTMLWASAGLQTIGLIVAPLTDTIVRRQSS